VCSCAQPPLSKAAGHQKLARLILRRMAGQLTHICGPPVTSRRSATQSCLFPPVPSVLQGQLSFLFPPVAPVLQGQLSFGGPSTKGHHPTAWALLALRQHRLPGPSKSTNSCCRMNPKAFPLPRTLLSPRLCLTAEDLSVHYTGQDSPESLWGLTVF